MKYLDYPELESLSRALTFESAECKVFTRIEAYSCKAVKREKQLFKTLETQYLQSASLSPPNHVEESLSSPFGRLDQSHARKTLFLLIATLNGAFPDHDFSSVHPSDFRREGSSHSVLNSLGTTLTQLRGNSNAPRSFSSFPSSYDEEDRTSRNARQMAMSKIVHPQLDAVLDDIMCIPDCEVYTFHPDADSDPHASAEPDEEGNELDDERYADDESVSEDGRYDGGQDTRMSTPQRASSSFDEEMDDAPMFDEDLLGFGFTPVHSRISSAVTTPRTPSSTVRTRAGDFFSSKKQRPSGRPSRTTMAASAPSRMAHSTLASRMSFGGSSMNSNVGSYLSDEDLDDEYDDDGQGLNGLLWATYAFFYNRKQKRILFVSVWSRRNNAGPTAYSFSPPSYPSVGRPMDDVPPLSIEQAITEDGPMHNVSSPAKRAIARSTGTASRVGRTIAGAKRSRDLSASPAPSARSPFPHDSPQRQREEIVGVQSAQSKGKGAPIPGRMIESTTTTASPLRHANSPSNVSTGAPPVVASSFSSSGSSVKRGLTGSTDDEQRPTHLDQSARKQRKVNALSG